MSDLFEKLQLVFAKNEATEGTAATLAGTDAMLASNLKVREVPRDFHSRTFNGFMGNRSGVIGAVPLVNIGFDTEVYGNGSNTVPQISPLLKTCFGALNTDTLASTATGGSSTVITTASTSGLTAGNAILVETASGSGLYEMTWVTSFVVNTSITVAPALTFAPASGATLKGTTTYSLADTGHPASTIANYLNNAAGASQSVQYVGCHGNAKFSAKKAGDIPMISWSMFGWNWAQATGGTVPSSISYGGGLPPQALATIFKLAGTQTNVMDLEWDLGNVITAKTSQNSSLGVFGTPVTDRQPKGKFRIYADSTSIAPFTLWQAGTTATLSQQFGNTWKGTVGWYVPAAQRTKVSYGNDGGIVTNDIEFNANITSGADSIYLAVG